VEDFLMVQEVIEKGDFLSTEDRRFRFVLKDDLSWDISLKITKDGSEIYLTTYHRLRRRGLASFQKKVSRNKNHRP
jgi:hypothetical protein